MATLLFSQTIAEQYKEVSDVINSVNTSPKADLRTKTLKELMQESFFHGATKFGDNFIA